MVAENMGIPAVVNTCEEFAKQAHGIFDLGGMPWAQVVYYPGHIDTYDLATRETYISELVAPGNEEALTTQIEAGGAAAVEAPETAVAFKGTFDEVNGFFGGKLWSDGLPVVPPTVEKVEEFLKYTELPADKAVGPAMEPSFRYATPWTVAVNGVMCGCRPEYMPVLIAMAQAIADPEFRVQDSGSTPGWEAMTILNGPIIKQLGFNYQSGVLIPGPQANTSVGRFWKMFQRNVVGIRVDTATDKGTLGDTWRVVLAENDDACGAVGWEPLHVQRGFKPDDNVITMVSVRAVSDGVASNSIYAENDLEAAEFHLDYIVHWVLRMMEPYECATLVPRYHLLVMSPVVAAPITKGGYSSKADVERYLLEHSLLTAREFEYHQWLKEGGKPYDLCEEVANGRMPKEWCESTDPNRMVPVLPPDSQWLVVVSGDPGRNRSLVCRQNFTQGWPTSKKIELPANWDELMEELA